MWAAVAAPVGAIRRRSAVRCLGSHAMSRPWSDSTATGMDEQARPETLTPSTQAQADDSRSGAADDRPTFVARQATAAFPPEIDEHGLSLPIGSPSFARGLWRIAAADVSSGNRVTLLRDGPATFSAMLSLIDAADRVVDLEGYIFRDDLVGQLFAQSLMPAAQPGVTVRQLGGWIGRMGTPRAFFAAIARAGVNIRLVNLPGFRPWLGLVPRDHR